MKILEQSSLFKILLSIEARNFFSMINLSHYVKLNNEQADES